jgi:chloramphenicol O-acetyltransferase type A
MGFLRIDFDKWDRREIFQYFKGTTMYVDKHIDITGFLSRVKESRLKFYPSVIQCLASV